MQQQVVKMWRCRIKPDSMVVLGCLTLIMWCAMPVASGGEKGQGPGNLPGDRLSGGGQNAPLSGNILVNQGPGNLRGNRLLGGIRQDLLSGSLQGEGKSGSIQKEQLSGNIQVDLFGLTAMHTGPDVQDGPMVSPMPPHKSPWLAAGLSLLIPGAGEFYAESYWNAALFLAVDVAALALAYTSDKRGNRQTDSFQAYANENWSVVQYAQYTQDHLVQVGKTYDWRVPGTEGMDPFDHPWTQVNWSEINRMEREIAGYYSHTLPAYNEQQYYELIGKYPQFGQGWRDANLGVGSDYESIKNNLSPMFLYYSGERGTANDSYAAATTWVTVAIINHILSAVDAAWSAGLYNGAHASVGMRMVPAGTGYEGMAVFEVRIQL
jgi:hypothetical protein